MIFAGREYEKINHELALGVELADKIQGGGLICPAIVEVERKTQGQAMSWINKTQLLSAKRKALSQISRHDSGRYSIRYGHRVGSSIDLRIYDNFRFYVPRRFRIPILPPQYGPVGGPVGNQDYMAGRSIKVTMYPGAVYPACASATGIRGVIIRGGQAVRWAYISAKFSNGGNGQLWNARGDDRGEFTLFIDSGGGQWAEPPVTVDIDITVHGQPNPPAPPYREIGVVDALWDLPIDDLSGAPAGMLEGKVAPLAYTKLKEFKKVSLTVGSVITRSGANAFQCE